MAGTHHLAALVGGLVPAHIQGRDSMNAPPAPGATYRLQFNRNFTFSDATAIIPYLQRLGITHVYASPILKARAGSPHGYDIVDHNALNPEIGDSVTFNDYVDRLHQHDMGMILDIVPNHMAVGGDDNQWWLDVLENGEASTYATFFDIDWHPVNPELHDRILIPLLGDHYGRILEQGDLKLFLDPGHGSFCVRYYQHLFPVDPRTYPQILALRTSELEQLLGEQQEDFEAYMSLIAACTALPPRTDLAEAQRKERQAGTSRCKQQLAELCQNSSTIRAFVQENVDIFNGEKDKPHTFDPLHHLLESQAYHLAYWQVAADEINYRRFFDINALAGIRVEHSEVFEATHRFIRQLIQHGRVNGLRIDHPDGLSNPIDYCHNLQQLIHESLNSHTPKNDASPSLYLVIEKILASYERLSNIWPVAGTTGYETAYLLNGLFVYPESQRLFDRVYRRFTGEDADFDELLYERKKLIIHSTLSSELTVLANLLSTIAKANRHTRDFTYHGLRNALSEVVACFPVYRTYIAFECISEEDRRYLQWAIAHAKKRSPAADILIFDFIHDSLLLNRLDDYTANMQQRLVQFTLRFQQYTAPVMAKGMEDTTFYLYNRLVSLNDVGFDPRVFAISINAFHHENKQRLSDWPCAMVCTSTHDSKRGEDVRARINVLSEVDSEWHKHLVRWSRINRSKKLRVNDRLSPSRNDEYLLYQTLIGTWPLESLEGPVLQVYAERMEQYMLKAIKEAKVHTSWINPNVEYEQAVSHFVHTLLDNPERNAFLTDFISFQQSIVRFGLLNSLSQTVLKLTIPGVPDIYQGNELWAFNLVDPDNRQPVDYDQRERSLLTLIELEETTTESAVFVQALQKLLAQIENGRIKLYLTWKILGLRRQYPRLFEEGDYLSLANEGVRAAHICSFARRLEERQIVVIAPRWFARLLETPEKLFENGWNEKIWNDIWTETWIEAPPVGKTYQNILTREIIEVHDYEKISDNGERNTTPGFNAAEVFKCFPYALLINL